MVEFLSLLRERRTRLVGIWIVVMLIVLVRLLTMPDMYTASILLTPMPLERVESQPQGTFGATSVRSLLDVGSRRDDYAVAAFLQSGQLLSAIIEHLDLAPELFPRRWDSEEEEWAKSGKGKPSTGQLRRALSDRIDASYEQYTGLLTIEVHWPNPKRAYEIAQGVLEVADRMLRDAAVAEGERRVAELRREMERATVGEVRVYLAQEMTRTISSLTSIRARARYAFRVIDPPVVPDKPSWPPRLFLFLLAGMAVAVVEIGVVAGVYLRAAPSQGRRVGAGRPAPNAEN